MQTIEQALDKLERSKFRSSFHLTKKEREYLEEKGMETIRRHTEDFVRIKLSPAHPLNDGKQTPMRGHPVFIAQHATATCCRDCLWKWHGIPKGHDFSPQELDYVVAMILAWLHDDFPHNPT